jgi:hypothetical protein
MPLFLGRPIRRGRPGRGRRRQPLACFRGRPRFLGRPRFGRVAISCSARETNPPLRFTRPMTRVSMSRLGPNFSAREIVTGETPMHFATSLANKPLSSRQRLSSSPVICSSREYAVTQNCLQRQKCLNALISRFFCTFQPNAPRLSLTMRLRRLICALLVALSQMGRRPRIYLIISLFPSRKRFRIYRD